MPDGIIKKRPDKIWTEHQKNRHNRWGHAHQQGHGKTALRGVNADLALNFETVAPEALKADYWMNLAQVDSKKEIADRDPRYESFKSFRTNGIYNNTRRVNDIGSNDYWESGAVSPDVILADLIHILHPELLPNHVLVYYKQLQ